MESAATNPIEKVSAVPEPLGRTLLEELPEIESFTSLLPTHDTYISENKPYLLNAVTVNPHFFEIFNLPFIQGDRTTSLNDGTSAVITSQTAAKLFPNQQAIGKTISRKSDGKVGYFVVTAIIENIPPNTHFNADIIIPTPVTSKTLDLSGYTAVHC